MARARTSFDPQLFLSKVGKGKSTLQSPKKHTIFSQGDAAEAVFYIQAGKVKLTVVSQQGKEAVVAILERGAFFGESCLAGQAIRTSTARARLTLIGSFRQRREAGDGHREDQSGNARRDDRHHTLACEFFHEQVPQTGFH
jgi:hypothetical protein